MPRINTGSGCGEGQPLPIRYDREFNVDSKAECDQLNLAHETKTNKRQCPFNFPV